MAEATLFSLATKILSTIASPAFEKAYERAKSIHGARKELDELRQTIRTIQCVLRDAVKRKEGSELVKNWMEKVSDVLYDADDLFDEVDTIDLLKEQIKGNELLKKVQIFSSKLNPIVSDVSIAKKVKAIKKHLHRISVDMDLLGFVKCLDDEKPISMSKHVIGAFVDPDKVIGRVHEKETILKFLLDESVSKESVSVLAVVGIGGMGKTTLAQLVYSDNKVEKLFNRRWWACISDIVDEKEVFEKISQSMGISNSKNYDVSTLQFKISSTVSSVGKYFLVLDDVWDISISSPTLWFNVMSLLQCGAQGSKVVVTTRFWSVSRAMLKDKSEILELGGLSEDKSWELFKIIAYTQEQDNSQEWIRLGREILSKCANVPLAIKSIATILRTKTTKQEWESIKNEKLLRDGTTMSALRLSYHHLPSYLKPCFAYCSLIPKDHLIHKDDLVYLWIAQGYVTPKDGETFEAVGHCYFMDLLNWSFFQEAIKHGDQIYYKMHDLVHDLAENVSGVENSIIVEGSNYIQLQNKIRHLRIICKGTRSVTIPSTLHVDRLRSFLLMNGGSLSPAIVDQLLTKSKLLRTLCLRGMHIKNVPSSIGELLHLRYLDLSWNEFDVLPNSITKLVNLISLNVSYCRSLKTLPNDVYKLVNLRQLNTKNCVRLIHMPPGLGKLTQLQSLSYFKVGRSVGSCKISRLDELVGLNISGKLHIDFSCVKDGEDCWQVPSTITDLKIENYKGVGEPYKITFWPSNLSRLHLYNCSRIKHLPPLRCLPCLETLKLESLCRLKYVEDHVEAASSTMSIFFPCLKHLVLMCLPKMERWSGKVEILTEQDQFRNPSPYPQMVTYFPLLQELHIVHCPKLVSVPLSPRLHTLELMSVNEELMSAHNNSPLSPSSLSCLDTLYIRRCDWLKTFSCEAFTSLRSLTFSNCPELKKLYNTTSQLSKLEELVIRFCPQLESWEEDNIRVDWDFLPNLQNLKLTEMPNQDTLPECLKQRKALGKLKIVASDFVDNNACGMEHCSKNYCWMNLSFQY